MKCRYARNEKYNPRVIKLVHFDAPYAVFIFFFQKNRIKLKKHRVWLARSFDNIFRYYNGPLNYKVVRLVFKNIYKNKYFEKKREIGVDDILISL